MSDWRVVITDSEDETGVAMICISGRHANPYDPYVYSCCSRPHLECGTRDAAQRVATALTSADAEVC